MQNIGVHTTAFSTGPVNALYDLGLLEEMDDNEYVIEILSILLTETPQDLKDMKTALQEGKTEVLCRKAHKLKGSSGIIQAERLTSILEDIEMLGKKTVICSELVDLVENATDHYRSIEIALKGHLEKIKLPHR